MTEPVAFLTWDANGTTVTTAVDLIPNWDDTREAQITDSPIEDGSTITDHHQRMPEKLVVTAVVSQTPLHGGTRASLQRAIPENRFSPGGLFALTQAAGAVIGAVLDAIGFGEPDSGFETFQRDDPNDLGNDLHDKIIDAFENAYLVDLDLGVNSQSIRSYEGYLIERVTKTITTDDGEASRFEISLKKANIVSTSLIDLPLPDALPDVSKLAGALGGLLGGKRPPQIREDPDTSGNKNKSLLAMASDLL